MNAELREQVWKTSFKNTEDCAAFEDSLRKAFGLTHYYDSARLLIGRSLVEISQPAPLLSATKFNKRMLAGEHLFGSDLDLWLSAFILDGKLRSSTTIDDFRALVEAHWCRGYQLVREELERCGGNELKLVQRLAELLPDGQGAEVVNAPLGKTGEIRLPVGTISRTHPADKPIDFVVNGPGAAPHIAFMGATGKGKTRTGIRMALELVKQAKIPFLVIDPKGEFVADGKPDKEIAELGGGVRVIQVGSDAIPLDFLPASNAAPVRISTAAMRLRDTILLCCKSPGDRQSDLLRRTIEQVVTDGGERGLNAILAAYQQGLRRDGKDDDSVVSRLNELTSSMRAFEPVLSPGQFFSQSWVISIKGLPEELRRLVTLLLLDATSRYLLEQQDTPVVSGHRILRHLLVVDEARKVLQERRSQALVDLVREGRSRGSVVMLLSQDPSDFDGEADDFTGQLGTIVAFECAQTQRGLRSLRGAFGRNALSPEEFSGSYLPEGVAFVKLPGKQAERIRCWSSTSQSA